MDFLNKEIRRNRWKILCRIKENIMNFAAFGAFKVRMFGNIRIEPHFTIFNDDTLCRTAAAEQFQRVINRCTG